MQNQFEFAHGRTTRQPGYEPAVYDTYTGPGTTAKVNSVNPLNTFIQKS